MSSDLEKGPPLPTRLATRLLLSYALLAGGLLLAFLLAVTGLGQVNALLAELGDETLGDVVKEESLHRAAWTVEVEARRGIVSCEGDPAHGPAVAKKIAAARRRLEAVLVDAGAVVHPRLRTPAEGYAAFARRIEASPVCATVLSLPLRNQRLTLDEDLTNAWIDRLREVHEAIGRKDGEAKAIGLAAIRRGATLGTIAVVVAAILALAMARNVAHSMAELSVQARRVGEGDFTPLPALRGPFEVRTLAIELDRMRARLAELDQLKGAFIASVSHDLRTPLTRVREALGILADGTAGPLTPRQERVVSLARAACEREIRLVASLLDLSRIRAGQPLRREPGSSIDRVVEVVLGDLREEAEERGVSLAFAPEGVMPAVALDTALVERALANLVSNAISVSARAKTVRIERVVATRGPPRAPRPAAGWLMVRVRDEGPGVPEQVRARLFTPFVSSEVERGRERRGVGLGLSIAREMVRAHGGDVALLEDEGPGTTFAFWIPLDDATGDNRAPPAPALPAARTEGGER